MLLKKLSLMVMKISMFSTMMLLSTMEGLSLDLIYHPSSSFMNSFDFGMIMNKTSILFLFMVSLVTVIVLAYAEVYMENYNNSKFGLLLISFYFTMLMLVLSNTHLILMMGWDGLGISSIFLIMFYPNKTTLYNSFLTMFFNRLSDVIMVIFLSLTICSFCWSFNLFEYNYTMVLMLTVCAFTKSAQFPLSTWLPAAMSAPTPISAMVHSSTLVTAGIFLINKFYWSMMISGLIYLIMFVSIYSFMLGGVLGCLEKDFKKIVAFSTMSQISMIISFCSLNFSIIGMTHMIFHAFFKTLLFCCSGLIFYSKFSEQFFLKIRMNLKSNMLMFMMMLSVFSMSGLPFSSSFFSKDLFLELMFESKSNMVILFLLIGSFFTILYSSKLTSCLISFMTNKLVSSLKFFSSVSLGFMFGCVMLFPKLFVLVIVQMSPLLELVYLNIITLMITIPFIMNFKFPLIKVFLNFSFSVGFMKYETFSFLNLNLSKMNILKNFNSDHFFFKPQNFNFLKILPMFNFNISLYLLILMLFFFALSF